MKIKYIVGVFNGGKLIETIGSVVEVEAEAMNAIAGIAIEFIRQLGTRPLQVGEYYAYDIAENHNMR